MVYVLVFLLDNEVDWWKVLVRVFVLEGMIELCVCIDWVLYDCWVCDGVLIVMLGNVVDYEYVKVVILKDVEDFEIEKFEID